MMMTMKLTMTRRTQIEKKKRVHASYLRARERDVHGVCLFVSLSLLVVLVKKNELGDVVFVLHISTYVCTK